MLPSHFLEFPFFIGLRYVFTRRRQRFISFISLVSLLGMILGVAALIVTLSVMNGFASEMRDRILQVIPHGFVEREDGITDWRTLADTVRIVPGVVAAAPLIEGRVLLTHAGRVLGVSLEGIDTAEEAAVSKVPSLINSGSIDSLLPGEFAIVLGSGVARTLKVKVGDRILVVLPDVSVTPAGVFPRVKRFVVGGIFRSGAQIDSTLALVHISDAARLLRRGNKVDALKIITDDIYRAPDIIAQLPSRLGTDYRYRSWQDTQGNLFKAIRMERTIISLLLTIIVAVAAFNILSILVMMVADKRVDIAVLRTIGARPSTIMQIFMVQGSAIGIIGVTLGAVTGTLLALNLEGVAKAIEQLFGIQFFDPSMYYISYFPSDWHWQDTVIVCVVSLAMSFLATLYPAWRSSQIEPVQALRYD